MSGKLDAQVGHNGFEKVKDKSSGFVAIITELEGASCKRVRGFLVLPRRRKRTTGQGAGNECSLNSPELSAHCPWLPLHSVSEWQGSTARGIICVLFWKKCG